MATPRRAKTAKPSVRTPRTPREVGLLVARWVAIVAVAMAVIGAGVFGAAYAFAPIPNPNKDFRTNVSTVMYRDNETQLGTFAIQNRQSLAFADMPQNVKDAIVAQENETFWTDPGISVSGLFRAVLTALGPGDTVGGSTITQQYVKIMYLNQDKTLTRKFKEIIVALKINQDLSKEQILEGYLNSVYFGRGAYGIQTAARSFFDVDAKDLTYPQAIALTAMVNDPGRLDPLQGDKQRADLLERYQYSINQLVKTGKMTEAEKAQIYDDLPEFPALSRDSRFAGPNGYLLRMVQDELKAAGFTDAQINGGGYSILTTVDAAAQEAAVTAAQNSTRRAAAEKKKDPVNLHAAIASVDTATGGVLALYGGPDYVENNRNWATTPRPTGSTFKTWAVVGALRNGITLDDVFAGNTLLQATTRSSNPSFLELVKQMRGGPAEVVRAAVDAGQPNTNFDPVATIPLGFAEVSPLNAAIGYATLANAGKQVKPHIVSEVRDATGQVVYMATVTSRQTIEPDVANDTTYALTHVASEGTGRVVSALGYPVAGKTGTRWVDSRTGTTASWFVGYTRQISTAVMFVAGADGAGNLDEYSSGFYGSGYPASTWLAYMRGAQKGLPKLSFPAPTRRVSTQMPTITRTPTPTPTEGDQPGRGRNSTSDTQGTTGPGGRATADPGTQDATSDPGTQTTRGRPTATSTEG